MSEEMQSRQGRLIGIFDQADSSLLAVSLSFNCNSLVVSEPPAREDEPQSNYEIDLPNHGTLLGSESDLGEIPPEVDSLSSLPSEGEQSELVVPVNPSHQSGRLKRQHPKKRTTRKSSSESDEGEEEEEEWVEQKILRGSKRLKQSQKVKRQNPLEKKTGHCQCYGSDCLKSLCRCHQQGTLCSEQCSCQSCTNRSAVTLQQKKASLKNSFQNSGKVKSSPGSQCSCKKSQCVKKYCECFNSGKPCGQNCKCEGCKNQVQLQSHSHSHSH